MHFQNCPVLFYIVSTIWAGLGLDRSGAGGVVSVLLGVDARGGQLGLKRSGADDSLRVPFRVTAAGVRFGVGVIALCPVVRRLCPKSWPART